MRFTLLCAALATLTACGAKQAPCPAQVVAEESPAATQKPLLDKVIAQVEAVQATGAKLPIVVFDLDATLYDNRMRTFRILRLWARRPEQAQSAVAKQVLSLKLDQMEYLYTDSLAKVGVTDAASLESIGNFWKARFFSDWAVHDEPMPGGLAYVHTLREKGAFIVYLTGRSTERMLQATADSLHTTGYPIGLDRTQLIMKPNKDTDDTEFKQTVMKNLAKMGEVVALFDNEPGNVNVFKTAFPDAQVVFLRTAFNPKNAEIVIAPGIPTIIDFRR